MNTNVTWVQAKHGVAAIIPSSLVLLIVLGFYGYAYSLGGGRKADGYELSATFLSSNGLHPGADVVLAGVKVGTITAITLDEHSMMSVVHFHVERSLQFPVDTQLSIGSSTLTSGNALIVIPGTSGQMLNSGANLKKTCELISLEQQISQYIFGAGEAPADCEH